MSETVMWIIVAVIALFAAVPPLSYLFGKYMGRGLAAAKPQRERDQDGTPRS